jgi:hypothetical protein
VTLKIVHASICVSAVAAETLESLVEMDALSATDPACGCSCLQRGETARAAQIGGDARIRGKSAAQPTKARVKRLPAVLWTEATAGSRGGEKEGNAPLEEWLRAGNLSAFVRQFSSRRLHLEPGTRCDEPTACGVARQEPSAGPSRQPRS